MTPEEKDQQIAQCLREATGLRIREAGLEFWRLLLPRIDELKNPPLVHAALGYILALSAKVLIRHEMNVADLLKLEEFGAALGDNETEAQRDDRS